jgi:hypothetical protein
MRLTVLANMRATKSMSTARPHLASVLVSVVTDPRGIGALENVEGH